MGWRLVPAAVLIACIGTPAAAQGPAPNLTRQQRELLQALVAATDAATAQPPTPDVTWQSHVLRASDGSHYVAFSVTPASPLPDVPVLLYVRLSTANTDAATVAERSAVREWLNGSKIDPRLQPRRAMAVGDMPPMGAGAIGSRGGGSVGSSDLQLLDLQRERARQRKDDDEKQRRAVLEGTVTTPTNFLPFEDFELASAAAFADGTKTIQRALTAGPGAYDLFVAWVDAAKPAGKAPIYVARQSLMLETAAPELALSSVIVADRIGVRAAPYNSTEQRAHPYAIGMTEIVPARDATFTPDERLAAAFQIINPAAGPSGKPDLVVNLRIVRVAGLREEPVASLSPLHYSAATLPADFDVRLGHPVIAALALPLATIPRGTHRLLVAVEDRVSSAVVSGRVEFVVSGTPLSLLAEAPPLGPKFVLAASLSPPTLGTLADRLAPANPSAALSRALQVARTGRLAELLIEEPVAPAEHGTRAALTALALLSLGDLGAIAHLERARAEGAAPAVVDFLLGVARAVQNRDADAIARWRAALDAGLPRECVAQWLAEAYLRSRDFARAADALQDVDLTASPALQTTLAAVRIATQRESDAITLLDALVARTPTDPDAQWLLLHAMYAQLVTAPNGPNRDRFVQQARRYVEANGRNAPLAAEWLKQITNHK
jgi:hypothetical protein